MRNFQGMYPIHFAAMSGYTKCITTVQDHLHPDVRDDRGKTPLFYAVEYEHFEVIDLLLRSGADVHVPEKMGGLPVDFIAKMTGLDRKRLETRLTKPSVQVSYCVEYL